MDGDQPHYHCSALLAIVSSTTQRIAFGIGTLLVVILTISAAFFLALGDLGSVAQATPTPTETLAPTQTPTSAPSSTPTIIPATDPPPPTDTPAPTATSVETLLPAIDVTAAPTDTPTLVPPTGTAGLCEKPGDWVEYVVQRGDTLNSLASRVGLSVFDLQQRNCLTNSTLTPGQVVFLPFAPAPPTATDTPTLVPTSTPVPKQEPTLTFTPTPVKPIIDGVSPKVGTLGVEVRLIILGQNLGLLDERGVHSEAGFRVELRMVDPTGGAVSQPLQVVPETKTSSSVETIVPANLPEGCYELVIINPDGRLDIEPLAYTNNATLYPCELTTPTPTFTPTATPQPPLLNANSCTPNNGSAGVTMTCTGNFFEPLNTLTVELTNGLVTRQVNPLAGSTNTSLLIPVPDSLEAGAYDLRLTRSNSSVIETDAYTVNAPTATPAIEPTTEPTIAPTIEPTP